jgi:hypothetical protein
MVKELPSDEQAGAAPGCSSSGCSGDRPEIIGMPITFKPSYQELEGSTSSVAAPASFDVLLFGKQLFKPIGLVTSLSKFATSIPFAGCEWYP